MKKTVLLTVMSIACFAFSNAYGKSNNNNSDNAQSTITVGFLKGGATILGAELEFLVSDRVGLQAGAGFIGFSAGINYHIKPTIRSSFLTFEYINQGGLGDNVWLRLAGPAYVHRGDWFSAKLGLGFTLETSDGFIEAMEDRLGSDYEVTPVMLTYAIGVYFPLR